MQVLDIGTSSRRVQRFVFSSCLSIIYDHFDAVLLQPYTNLLQIQYRVYTYIMLLIFCVADFKITMFEMLRRTTHSRKMWLRIAIIAKR